MYCRQTVLLAARVQWVLFTCSSKPVSGGSTEDLLGMIRSIFQTWLGGFLRLREGVYHLSRSQNISRCNLKALLVTSGNSIGPHTSTPLWVSVSRWWWWSGNRPPQRSNLYNQVGVGCSLPGIELSVLPSAFIFSYFYTPFLQGAFIALHGLTCKY